MTRVSPTQPVAVDEIRILRCKLLFVSLADLGCAAQILSNTDRNAERPVTNCRPRDAT